jgi:hypothetical protein
MDDLQGSQDFPEKDRGWSALAQQDAERVERFSFDGPGRGKDSG